MCTNQFIKKTFLTHNDKIETLRKHIDQKELELLTDILKDGVKNGIFAIGSPKTFAGYLHPIFKSLEFSCCEYVIFRIFSQYSCLESGIYILI
jgi:DNA-binding MurR/RpiR family transcriptional regulator